MTQSVDHFNPDVSPPAFQSHLIREHLLQHLHINPKKLTLVQAPPGYGKTSFLKQIHDFLPEPGLWMNLRDTDNDPVDFLLKCTKALASLHPDNKYDAIHQATGFSPPSLALWTRSLVDEMNAQPHLNLFFNDIDFVTEPKSLALISMLLEMSHSGIRVFATASSITHFAYANLLMENQVASITQEALRFSKEDIQQLFTLYQRHCPSDNLAQQLADLSEGWPAASNFIASTYHSESEINRFVEDASLRQQAFDRYFIERVFEQQSLIVQSMLLRISFLDRFNLAICQALSDDIEQSRLFWQFVQQHTFITPIDEVGGWYRCHQLFSLFLRHRYEISYDKCSRSQWQIAAASWFMTHHYVEDAIRLALQAQAYEQAAGWMEDAFPSVVVRFGKHVTYLTWYSVLPEDIIFRFPRARIGYIWAMLANRHFLNVAEQLQWLIKHQNEYPETIQQNIKRTTALILCTMEGLKDNAREAAPLAKDWLEKWDNPNLFTHTDDHHYENGLALVIKGYAAKCLSEFQEARDALNAAMRHFEAYGSYYGQTWAKSLMAVTYAKQGFHHEAQREAMEGHQMARLKLGEKSHNGFGLAALLAAMNYEHDEIETARSYLKDILPYLKEQSATDLLIAAFETHAKLFMFDQAFEEGFGFIKDGMKWAESQHLPRLKYKLLDILITELVTHNRLSEAELYASEYALILKSSQDFDIREPKHNITSRSIIYMLWQREAYEDAQIILNVLLARSRKLSHLRRTGEWLKLKALTYLHQGMRKEATKKLIETLHIANTQNYYRMLLDEPGVSPLLESLSGRLEDKSIQRFLNRLLEKSKPISAQNNKLIDPLTTKEIEIIQCLSEGLPNKAIAEQLFVSIGTLKWHLHNIYSKLQVKNRTQALLEAKKQGYL